MNEQEFISSMRVLFRVWRGTENADTILTDVVATIGSQCFDKTGLELRALEAECGSQQSAGFAHSTTDDCQFAKFEDEPPPPALKLEMERDLKGAVAMGKVWGEVFDNLFAPKR